MLFHSELHVNYNQQVMGSKWFTIKSREEQPFTDERKIFTTTFGTCGVYYCTSK